MKKLLSASEMKQVRGGAEESSYCRAGEKLYTCTTTFTGGAQSTGVVCAKDGFSAGTAIQQAFSSQLAGDENVKVVQTACS